MTSMTGRHATRKRPPMDPEAVRFAGIDPEGVVRVFGLGHSSEVAESRCVAAITRYIEENGNDHERRWIITKDNLYFVQRRMQTMAKNSPKTGRSMRSGNAASPYNKYSKRPAQYDMRALEKKFPGMRTRPQDDDDGEDA